MAIIKCSECGKEISDKAETCVHCGKKIITSFELEKKENKKIKKKKRRKVFKIIILTLLLIGLSIIAYLLISFFNPKKSIDFTKKYKDYLDYALGEGWKVIGVDKYKTIKNFWTHEYYYWQISYKDENGDYQELRIDNYDLEYCNNEELCSDYIFASSIAYAYSGSVEDVMMKSKTSELDDYINIIDIYSIDSYKYAKNSLKAIDPKTGLSFKKINIDQFDSELYYLELSVLYKSGNDINTYTINEAKKIIKKYKIKNAIISAGYSSNGSAFPIYCIKAGKEVTCPEQVDLYSMNEVMMNPNNYIYLN